MVDNGKALQREREIPAKPIQMLRSLGKLLRLLFVQGCMHMKQGLHITVLLLTKFEQTLNQNENLIRKWLVYLSANMLISDSDYTVVCLSLIHI